MRRITITIVVFALCVMRLVDGAEPKQDNAPKASDGWPMVLLSQPFHIGDQDMEDMVQVKAMGGKLVKKFDLDQGALPLYVGVWMDSTVGPKHKQFKRGHYQIKLLINGKEIEVLNKRLVGRRTPGKPKKVVVRLESKDVQKGLNTLTIKGGGKNKNLSECEIHKILLSRSRL